MELKAALESYLKHLEEKGLSKMSLYTYGKDSLQVEAFFGESCDLSKLNRQAIGRFLKSDELRALPNGKERAEKTINKTIGFFRRFVEWSIEQSWITENPLPKTLAS